MYYARYLLDRMKIHDIEDYSDDLLCGQINERAQVTLESKNIVSLFPNPTSGALNLKPNYPLKDVDIYLVDFSGKEVLRLENISIMDQYDLNLTSLSAGIYMLNIILEDSKQVEKVVLID